MIALHKADNRVCYHECFIL